MTIGGMLLVAIMALCVAIITTCDHGEGLGRHDSFFSDDEWEAIQDLSPLPPVPSDPTNAVADLPLAAELGQKFFFDSRFSGPLVSAENEMEGTGGNGSVGEVEKVSCSRCHNPSTSFTDQRSVPANTSLAASRTSRHTPTVLNAAYNAFVFWDGRKDSLWSQALGPTESPTEMNFNRVGVVQLIQDKYRAEYEAIFGAMPNFRDAARFPQVPNPPDFSGQGRPGDGPGGPGLDAYDEMSDDDKLLVDTGFANYGKCIEAYERLIVSRDSAFDQFVAGDDDAISAPAKRGLKLFISGAFCLNCHAGPNFSDGDFRNLGLSQTGGSVPLTDVGRINGIAKVLGDPFNGAGVFSDDPGAGAAKLARLGQDISQVGQFKTPSLRSVSSTQPYFHTGSAPSLRAVTEFYNRGGDGNGFSGVAAPEMIPLAFTNEDQSDLVEFLETLEGAELSAALTTAPDLPP